MDPYQIQEGMYVYFITFTIKDWLPIFINPETIEIITESLRYSIDHKHLRINAYVIMPNHLHMIVFDEDFDNDRLKKCLIEFRKYTGHLLADYIDQHLPNTLSRIIHETNQNDRRRQVWQRDWYAEGIIGEEFWELKINYIHMNPVRKGFVDLPEQWRNSSARFWLDGEDVELPITDTFGENH